jgi:hypothetical protein
MRRIHSAQGVDNVNRYVGTERRGAFSPMALSIRTIAKKLKYFILEIATLSPAIKPTRSATERTATRKKQTNRATQIPSSINALHFAAMQRRQARERRDYLYRRALTLRDAELASKRAALKQSLSSGRPLTKDLAEDTVSPVFTPLRKLV